MTVDRERLFHPETIARSRAHGRSGRACPANGKGTEQCTCLIDPEDLDECWEGRARMARARRAAGVELDAIDEEALAR